LIEIGYPSFLASKILLSAGERSSSSPKFIKNEIVQGKVLKTFSSKDVLLLIKGKQVMAKTHLPLSAGRVLSLKVEQAVPVPTLKLLGIKLLGFEAVQLSTILSAVKHNLWKSVFENLAHHGHSDGNALLFRKLMNDLSLGMFLDPSADLLKILIDKSGLGWERKLREICTQKKIDGQRLNMLIAGDIKGLGSRLLAHQAEPETLMDRLMNAIKNIQLLNHFGLEQEKKIYLPIPIQFSNGLFTVGQLLIHLNQEEQDKHANGRADRSYHKISFVLELSNLGPLRADLMITAKTIEGRFLLADKTAKALVDQNLDILIKNLKTRGFTVHHMGCYLKDPEFITQPLLKELIQEEGSSISLVA